MRDSLSWMQMIQSPVLSIGRNMVCLTNQDGEDSKGSPRPP